MREKAWKLTAATLVGFAVAGLPDVEWQAGLPAGFGVQSAQSAAGSIEKRVFALIDRNRDGEVDDGEFNERKMEVFFMWDKDRDTYVSRAEFETLDQAVFDSADMDGDGRLSGFEFNQASFVNFEAFDGNHDGIISFEEFEAFRARLTK